MSVTDEDPGPPPQPEPPEPEPEPEPVPAEVAVAGDVRLDQLAAELQTRFGSARPPVLNGRHRPDGTVEAVWVPADLDLVAVGEVLAAHTPVWPPPPPDPIEVFEETVQSASTVAAVRDALQQLPGVLRDLRRQVVTLQIQERR